MFKYLFENITEKEYRESERPSYSFWKRFSETGPKAIIEPSLVISGPGLTLGSIVDKLLSEPGYDPELEYSVSDISIDWADTTNPTKILKFLRDNKDIVLEKNDMDVFARVCSMCDIKRNPVPDEDFWSKVKLLSIINNGINVISSKELELAYNMANTFKTHEYTKDVFTTTLDEELVYQAKGYFTSLNVKQKIMLDVVKINHKDKTISPYDIKTGAAYDFMLNFWKYKYYYQAAEYTLGLKHLIKGTEYADYTIKPFKFIYLSRENTELPLVYEMSEEFIDTVLNGWTTNSGYEYKGLYRLMSDYSWYIDNQIFNIDRSIYENSGVIKINSPK